MGKWYKFFNNRFNLLTIIKISNYLPHFGLKYKQWIS